MNERNPIDGFFRDKLYDHSMEPPMHLWDALDARRTAQVKQANQRRLGLLLVFAALFLGVIGGFLIWTNQEIVAPEIPATPIQEQEQAPVATLQPRVQDGTNIEFVAPNGENNANTSTAVDGVIVGEDQSQSSRFNAPEGIQDETLAKAKTNRKATLGTTALSGPAVPAPNQINSVVQTTTINTPPPAIAPLFVQENGGTNPLVNTVEKTETTKEEVLFLKPFEGLEQRNSTVEYEPNFAFEGGPLILPKTRGWRVYGELFGAVDVPKRSLAAREPEFESYRQAREQSEQVQPGQRVALRFSMISIDGIAVRSGLSYGTHQETFTYQQQIQSNRFQTIDIPIILGYERNNLGKFTLSANAGVYVNMAFNQHGSFLAPDLNKTLEFSSNKPDAYPAFRNSLGLAWYGSIAASYPITPRLRLVLEPYVLHNQGSFTAKDYAIDQRYQNWGINIGIRKKINKYIYFAKP